MSIRFFFWFLSTCSRNSFFERWRIICPHFSFPHFGQGAIKQWKFGKLEIKFLNNWLQVTEMSLLCIFLLYFYDCSIFRSSIFPVLNSFVMDFKIFFPLLFFCLNELQEDFFTSSLNFPNTLFFKLYQYEKGNSHHSGNYNNLQLLIPHLTPSS